MSILYLVNTHHIIKQDIKKVVYHLWYLILMDINAKLSNIMLSTLATIFIPPQKSTKKCSCRNCLKKWLSICPAIFMYVSGHLDLLYRPTTCITWRWCPGCLSKPPPDFYCCTRCATHLSICKVWNVSSSAVSALICICTFFLIN